MTGALADLVVVVHAAFVVFVLLGGFLILRWPRVGWLHLPAAVWGAWVELVGWTCPLTPLEDWLREQNGVTPSGQSFIERQLLPLLYPAELTRELQWLFAGIVVAANALVYSLVLRRARRREALHFDRRG